MNFDFTMNILQIFAKSPVANQVKTRLIPDLGAEAATKLYERLTLHCLNRFAQKFDTQLWCAPDITHPFFKHCQQHYPISLHQQQGKDLGERMAFALGSTSQPTLLIGSDCPSLQSADIQAGFDVLQSNYQVVLAPAEDGGYVLVGMKQVISELFQSMPWSTNQVLAETRQRLRTLKVSWYELAMQWDVDRYEDVQRLEKLQLLY